MKMKSLRKVILLAWKIIFIWFWIFYFEQNILEPWVNSPVRGDTFGEILILIGHGLGALLVIILAIPCLPYYHLHLPREILTIGILSVILLGANYLMLYYEKFDEKKEKERELVEKKRQEAKENEIREEQIRKKKEIGQRKSIVQDIVNNLYKDTAREVNKTLISTLLYELQDIYDTLNSDNLNDIIIYGSSMDFQNNISFLKSELQRLKNLALEAQKRGYTDDGKEYANSEESNGKMTKEKAFEIFGIETTATKNEITKAYREMALKYHTDRWVNSPGHIKRIMEEEMKKLNNAKDYLSKLGLI